MPPVWDPGPRSPAGQAGSRQGRMTEQPGPRWQQGTTAQRYGTSLVTVGQRRVADVDGMVEVVNRTTGVKQARGAKSAEGTHGAGEAKTACPSRSVSGGGHQPWAASHHRPCHQDSGVASATSAGVMPAFLRHLGRVLGTDPKRPPSVEGHHVGDGDRGGVTVEVRGGDGAAPCRVPWKSSEPHGGRRAA